MADEKKQKDITQSVSSLLVALKRLNEYTAFVLNSENIPPGSLYARNQYIYSLLGLGLAFSEAALDAAEKDHVRGAIPSLRSLQECWINGRFISCTRSHIWMYYSVLQDELRQSKKRDKLHSEGKLDEARYRVRSKEAKKISSFIKKRYVQLPLIPNVITTRDQSMSMRKLTLKEKCMVIDYYESLRSYRPKRKSTTMVEHYGLVYNHFSETAHATPFGMNDLYKIEIDGRAYLDIHGTSDGSFAITLLLNVYLYQCELLDRFMRKVASRNKKLPQDIQDTVRGLLAAG